MISTECHLRVKEDILIQKWSTGASITLKYKLFCTLNSKLFLSIEKKINQQQRSLEKINWFQDHPICELQIDEIGYFGYILTETGYLIRLPLGIFGLNEAKEQWNHQVISNPDALLVNCKAFWDQVPKLKEISIVRIQNLSFSSVLNPITKKPSSITMEQLQQYSYLQIWRTNDSKQYAIIATGEGVILFYCLDSEQMTLALNLETEALKKVKLIETQSLSYLIVQHGHQDEYIQIILQKNNQDNGDNNQNAKRGKDNKEHKNLLNCYKSQQYITENFMTLNNNGFQLFTSEENGAIRLFFYCPKTKILKIYRPGNLSSSKYRFFIELNNVIEIIQWKNYYIVFQYEDDYLKLDFYLKTILQKCDKKTVEALNFKPLFPKPIFSYELYNSNITVIQSQNIFIFPLFYIILLRFENNKKYILTILYKQNQIQKVDSIIQLSDRTFQADIFKNNGIDILLIDLNHGKLELENSIHSDNFQINTYLNYELFLKNHGYDSEFCIQYLQSSLKTQQKWENLCLIDLQNKNNDPFKLFHEYSSIRSQKMEYLLFKSLLTAFDKVEHLEESFFNGFAFNILLGFYGVKISSFEMEENLQFKQMSTILQEQSLTPSKIGRCIHGQKLYSVANSQFMEYLKELKDEDNLYSNRYNKKIIDFQELNLIFKQKRYAELALNIICIVLSVQAAQIQRERLELEDLLQIIMIDNYWINEYYLLHIFKNQFESSRCPSFLKCIYYLILHNQKEVFHRELNFYLQRLNLEELFKLLNISIRSFKIMYQNKPFLNQNCIQLLLTQFHSLMPHEQAIKEFIFKSLVQSKAESNFKDINHSDVSTYFNLIQKIYKQKYKLTQGSYQKFLPGVDAIWLILQQIEQMMKNTQNTNNNKSAGTANKSEYSILKEAKQNALKQNKRSSPIRNKSYQDIDLIKEKTTIDYINVNNYKLPISTNNSIVNNKSSHFSFSQKNEVVQQNQNNNLIDKENQMKQRTQNLYENDNSPSPLYKNHQNEENNTNDSNSLQNEYFSTLLIQIMECSSQIQKLTSIKVKKEICPNQQLASLLSKLN